MQQLPLDSLEIYAYADLAAGKDAKRRSKRRARQCIVVGARDWLMRWFWIHIWAGRLTATQFKEKILDTQEKFKPRRFGLEANGMQVLFGSIIREEAKQRDIGGGIKMFGVYQPNNVDKNYRIRTGVEPILDEGRFFLQEKEIDARAEITGFPTAQTKDIIDSMEACVNKVAPRRVVKQSEDIEREEYASYLRSSGMPAHRISQELEKYKSGTDTGEYLH